MRVRPALPFFSDKQEVRILTDTDLLFVIVGLHGYSVRSLDSLLGTKYESLSEL